VVPNERAEVVAFLVERHRAPVTDLEPLGGGHWSSAWSYRTPADERELVVRFSELDFEVERAAMAYSSDALPVPEVLEIGHGYAISVRHHGRFLEDVRPEEVDRAAPMLASLLHALRDAPPGDGPSWRTYLLEGLAERDDSPTRGWRGKLARNADVEAVFERGADEVRRLVEHVSERRDLVHADLLHGNVLVNDDASTVTAIFSWKCSTRGDWLYDVAWCSFWSAWHPGIAAIDVWSHIDLASEDPADVIRRRRCYELQIGASHLGWYAWTGEEDELRRCAERTAALLDREPE
jgi:Ser/Thr protein kinase RdoA (MazF antagonist)